MLNEGDDVFAVDVDDVLTLGFVEGQNLAHPLERVEDCGIGSVVL